jgi:hypothetical protein
MSMSSKPNRKRISEIQATSTQVETGEVSLVNSTPNEESEVVHAKSISSVASNQAASWTIGSKRNGNSNRGCS